MSDNIGKHPEHVGQHVGTGRKMSGTCQKLSETSEQQLSENVGNL